MASSSMDEGRRRLTSEYSTRIDGMLGRIEASDYYPETDVMRDLVRAYHEAPQEVLTGEKGRERVGRMLAIVKSLGDSVQRDIAEVEEEMREKGAPEDVLWSAERYGKAFARILCSFEGDYEFPQLPDRMKVGENIELIANYLGMSKSDVYGALIDHGLLAEKGEGGLVVTREELDRFAKEGPIESPGPKSASHEDRLAEVAKWTGDEVGRRMRESAQAEQELPDGDIVVEDHMDTIARYLGMPPLYIYNGIRTGELRTDSGIVTMAELRRYRREMSDKLLRPAASEYGQEKAAASARAPGRRPSRGTSRTVRTEKPAGEPQREPAGESVRARGPEAAPEPATPDDMTPAQARAYVKNEGLNFAYVVGRAALEATEVDGRRVYRRAELDEAIKLAQGKEAPAPAEPAEVGPRKSGWDAYIERLESEERQAEPEQRAPEPEGAAKAKPKAKKKSRKTKGRGR